MRNHPHLGRLSWVATLPLLFTGAGCDRGEAAPASGSAPADAHPTPAAEVAPAPVAPVAAAPAPAAAPSAARAASPDCATLCREKSLGCANDAQCPTQCAEFRARCTTEADAVIACSLGRPLSDFQCNPVSKTTQTKPSACAGELSAYMACFTSTAR